MTPHDDSAPATKLDVKLLMTEMGRIYEAIDKLHFHFDVSIENLRHDFIGTTNDKFVDVRRRLDALEHHTGLAA